MGSDSEPPGGTFSRITMVLNGKLYFEGNAGGLVEFASLKPSPAQKYAGKWVAVNRSSAYFNGYAYSNGLTVSSTAQELDPSGTVNALPPVVFDGHTVDVLQERFTQDHRTVTMTIYVKATGAPLPIGAVQLLQGGSQATFSFGPWNIPPLTKAPSKWVPFNGTWYSSS